MAVFFDHDLADHISICNDQDFCYLCKNELIKKSKLFPTEAEKKLKNSLNGKKAVKFSDRGINYVICKKHINSFYKELEE